MIGRSLSQARSFWGTWADLERLPNGSLPILLEDLVDQEEHGLVVAKHASGTVLDHTPDTGTRLGSVADDIPQAEHPPDREVGDVL